MKIAFLVPYRSDGGRRDELWDFVARWLGKHHWGWEAYVGESPSGPFNRGAAINDASRQAGDWDIAIVHDADNICDPVSLRIAARRAHESGRCVFPYTTYVYLDELSTERVMSGDHWFIAPEKRAEGSFPYLVIDRHRSGIQAIPRAAWDKIGGYVEFEGWGYEDSATEVLLRTFADGVEHLPGAAYHLYHESSTAPGAGKDMWGPRNRQILGDMMSLEMLPDQLRDYMEAGGHKIP